MARDTVHATPPQQDQGYHAALLTNSFLHPYPTSCLLCRAASHMTIGETRQRPQNHKQHHQNRRPVKKQLFLTQDLFDLDFHNSTFFIFSVILVKSLRKPNQVFVDFVSTVFSVMCILTGLKGLLGTNGRID